MTPRLDTAPSAGPARSSVSPSIDVVTRSSLRAQRRALEAKKGRLARWTASSKAAVGSTIGVAGDDVTIQAGEVWLLLAGSKQVVPCIVYNASVRHKGGLRPQTD